MATNSRQGAAMLAFSTKANTLAQLSGVLQHARVLPLAITTWAHWCAGREAALTHLQQTLGGEGPWIVRSSAGIEDRDGQSLAGCFDSVADVRGTAALAQAVDAVFASYVAPDDADQVLVQPLLTGVRLSGVAFGCDPSSGAHYRIINWFDGDDTAAVTSGQHNGEACCVWVGQPAHDVRLQPVLDLLDELEALFATRRLDVEFAIDADGGCICLQVRPLTSAEPLIDDVTQAAALACIRSHVESALGPHPYLYGRRTVYGVMPDWNPAEIVGVRPRPLALSLYRELVTDSIWAYQRHNYGYRNLRSFPLLVDFHGLPYIDVRVSFNSFLPRDLDAGLATRLADYYIDRLLDAPSLHDKVEFAIVFSCYTLDLPQRLQVLDGYGFDEADRRTLAERLRQLTQRIIARDTGLWRQDRNRIDTLVERHACMVHSTLPPLQRLYWLLEDCKRYGTLPFAGLARAGFIAVQLLDSLVAVGVLSVDDRAAFMQSLHTVSGQLTHDIGRLDRTAFLSKYGHLRPGTYDILSPRYDEAPDRYFDWSQRSDAVPAAVPPFSLTLGQMREIGRLLDGHGLAHDVVGLFDFLQAGIEGRELAKFHFTRNLSDILVLLRQMGEQHGLEVDDLSYADIQVIRAAASTSRPLVDLLRASIDSGRERHAVTSALQLPPVLTDPAQVHAFVLPPTEPNFITRQQIVGPVAEVEADRHALRGAIVCIRGADPGYDWLFSHGIGGLITAYGGVNSHMAIRAGELGIPAVIGAGESLFDRWRRARRLLIDCAGRRVEVLG